MKKLIETVVLQNDEKQKLRIYKVENIEDVFCIGLEDQKDHHNDHFAFTADEAKEIITAIKLVAQI